MRMLAPIALALSLAAPSPARADWELVPYSREHLYRSYANFVDQQNELLWRGYNRYWGAVSVDQPLVGNNEGAWHPQLVLHLSANVAMHVNDGGGVFTETLDTRIGFQFQFAVPDLWGLRFSVGIQHESGHTVDGTDDPNLDVLDLGDNTFRFQAFRDLDQMVRVGLLVAPVINSIPTGYPALVFAMADYFPLGASEDSHHFKPYVSASVGHRPDIAGHWNVQLQTGLAIGSHFMEQHHDEFRFVVGYYYGADPRSKYAQYEHLRTDFAYTGIAFNL